MKTAIPIQKRLAEGLTQFLWDQWVTIGVAGSAIAKPVRFIIDPEALLLATSRFATGDSRMMGEVLDWLTRNGKSISIARLKTLQQNFGYGDVDALLAIADQLAAGTHKNWKALHSLRTGSGKVEEESPARYGSTKLRGMSTAPDSTDAANFLFTMRALFGMTARAEIVTWLLTHKKGHPAAIARETGWFSKTVQIALNEMERSGHVHSRQNGREKVFGLRHNDWAFFVPLVGTPGGWLSQGSFYAGCAGIAEALDAIVTAKGNAQIASMGIREQLESIGSQLERAGDLGDRFHEMSSLRGGELVTAFTEEAERFIGDVLEAREIPTSPFLR